MKGEVTLLVSHREPRTPGYILILALLQWSFWHPRIRESTTSLSDVGLVTYEKALEATVNRRGVKLGIGVE